MKYAAGIHHGLIQEQFKEFIAEVVVCLDIAATALQGVAMQVFPQQLQWLYQPLHARADILYVVAVAEEQLEQPCQVIALPVVTQVGITETHRAVNQQAGIKSAIGDVDRDGSREQVILPAEAVALVSFCKDELAVAQVFQPGVQDASGYGVEQAGVPVLQVSLVDA